MDISALMGSFVDSGEDDPYEGQGLLPEPDEYEGFYDDAADYEPDIPEDIIDPFDAGVEPRPPMLPDTTPEEMMPQEKRKPSKPAMSATALGGMLGSVIPGVGTAIGTAVGALTDIVLKKKKQKRMKKKSKKQMMIQAYLDWMRKKKGGTGGPCPLLPIARLPKGANRELAAGTRIEMEHTHSPETARRIASHHLKEHPRYYTYLTEMEKLMGRGSGGPIELQGYAMLPMPTPEIGPNIIYPYDHWLANAGLADSYMPAIFLEGPSWAAVDFEAAVAGEVGRNAARYIPRNYLRYKDFIDKYRSVFTSAGLKVPK